MARRIVTVTHPDGTKKVIVGPAGNTKPVLTREADKDRRPKPETPFTGLTKEHN